MSSFRTDIPRSNPKLRSTLFRQAVRAALLPALCTSLWIGACERKTTPEADSEQTAAKAKSTTAPKTAAPATPKASVPPAKEFEPTPDDRLGTLPEGLGIAIGKPIPEVSAQDSNGRKVTLGELVEKGPILVTFYRGGWCPYCNFQVRSLTEAHEQFQERGITPVAISVDQVSEAKKTQATYEIPFPVLSDPKLEVHRAFNVVHQADEAQLKRLKEYGIDLEKSSGETHHSYAVPALFLVDSKGIVRWAHADPDYTVRPKTKQLLAALDKAGFSPTRNVQAEPN